MRSRAVWLMVVFLVGLLGFGASYAQEIENLLTNGNFEDGTETGWGGYGGHTREIVTELVGANIPEEVVEGSYCMNVVVPTAGANFWDAGIQTFYSGVFESGKQYTFSVWLKSKEGALQLNLKPELAQDPWTGYGDQMVTITEEWAEYHVTTPVLTADVNPAQISIHVQQQAGEFWLDYAQLYVGDYVPTVFKPRTTAADPSPAGGAVDVPQDVILAWSPGVFAVAHDVYFGTAFDDVNNASRANPMGVLVSQGQTATTFDPPDVLDFGQTYYWRVDEVNAAPDSTIFKGDIWSFTAEPYVYPVQNIVATASSAEEGSGPEKTIDGSGLSAADEHSNAAPDMWLSAEDAELPAWIQYEFAEAYKLHEMWVWNYNEQFELLLGFGAKEVTLEHSVDGEDWTVLGDYEFAQGTARSTYTPNTTVDLDGVVARYVRLTIHSNWGGMMPQSGLSEVRFYYKPVVAREPVPSDGQTGLGLDMALDWRGGREAAVHEIYFSSDEQAVIEGTALMDTAIESRYEVSDLNLGTTYYWKVDEVNEAAEPSVWEGPVWSFSTIEYVVVEDFEAYDDDIDAGTTIFQTWIDGWENDTGSVVGHLEAPFAERIIVHGGRQSMPLSYENTNGLTVAEAVRTFDTPRNWTTRGIKTLSLYFRGTSENTGQLYVKIDNVKVPYDGEAADIATPAWQPWNIDLSAVGNVSNVRSLTIGIEGAGAMGLLYIDDIRLYPKEVEYVTPVEPDTADLVAYYAFDGDLNDASGNGYHGVANGDVAYGAGVEGQAVQLNGTDAYVSVAGVGITGAAPRTIAGWAKADTTGIPAWTNVFGFTGGSVDGQHFDIQAVGDTGTTTLGYYGLHRHGWEQDILPIDLEWHHLAATFDGTTVSWYGDGRPIGSVEVDNVDTPGEVRMGKRQDNDNFFPGSVDEVRIYDRALSDGEIAWLAGKTEPVHKPM